MKAILLLALVAAVFATRTVEDELKQWGDWKATYGKTFSPSMDVHRFGCFQKNLAKIDQFNARGAEMHSVNQFSHLCADEFASTYLGAKKPANHTVEITPTGVDAGRPQQVDWHTKGAVTPIKNQGQCGSCWAFSTICNMEGQWFLAGNTLTGLSEEELVQCDSGCYGCGGGWNTQAMKWTVQNGGIDSESDYPYTSGGGQNGACQSSKLSSDVAKFKSMIALQQDENVMATWLAKNGPLSVCLDASSWQTYSGGIMTNCYAGQDDHCVAAVGYDMTNSPPYWIVRNSWGTSWGENGYIRLEYGTNQCNINSTPASALVN